MTERVVAIDHPIGHAHHIPVEPNCFERIIARTTLNMRSVNVVIINLLMSPANSVSDKFCRYNKIKW